MRSQTRLFDAGASLVPDRLTILVLPGNALSLCIRIHGTPTCKTVTDQSRPPSYVGYGYAVSCDCHRSHCCCYCCPFFDYCASADESGSTSCRHSHPGHESHSHAVPCPASSSRAFSLARVLRTLLIVSTCLHMLSCGHTSGGGADERA